MFVFISSFQIDRKLFTYIYTHIITHVFECICKPPNQRAYTGWSEAPGTYVEEDCFV